jgi:hypothetical protein
MTCTFTVDPSWLSHPEALGRILGHIRALEAAAPWTPPAVREPGQDEDEDLRRLLDGIDTPEPAPAAPAVARPAQEPSPAATPPARDWDGVPRTGRSLYRWGCDHKCLPAVNRIGKAHGYAKRITDWADHEVAAAYAILTAEPTANGVAR